MNNLIAIKLINKRCFYTLSKGKKIGYIEGIYKEGYIFQTDFISFRETSSNIAHGNTLELSTTVFLYKKNEIWLLEDIMNKKKAICIEYTKDLIGLPTHGDLIEPMYLEKIEILKEHGNFPSQQT